MAGAFIYILQCADGSYYTGTARDGLERRVAEHNSSHYGGYELLARLASRSGLDPSRRPPAAGSSG